jgi:hypothetical protein
MGSAMLPDRLGNMLKHKHNTNKKVMPTTTLAEFLTSFSNESTRPDYAILIGGNEYRVLNTTANGKEGFWKLVLADAYKGKDTITAEATKVKVHVYELPTTDKQEQPKADVEQPKAEPVADPDLTSDFLINSSLIDRLAGY